jgi:hypothetical protein
MLKIEMGIIIYNFFIQIKYKNKKIKLSYLFIMNAEYLKVICNDC